MAASKLPPIVSREMLHRRFETALSGLPVERGEGVEARRVLEIPFNLGTFPEPAPLQDDADERD